MADLVSLIDQSGSRTYIGEAFSVPGLAKSSVSWKILQIDETVSGTSFLYADGAPTYTFSWTARSSLTYSLG